MKNSLDSNSETDSQTEEKNIYTCSKQDSKSSII